MREQRPEEIHLRVANLKCYNLGGYTVGVAGQTVNLLSMTRVVRLHLRPLKTLIVKALRLVLADKLREGTL